MTTTVNNTTPQVDVHAQLHMSDQAGIAANASEIASLKTRMTAQESRAMIPGPAGADGTNGKDGLNGKNGKDGADGRDGVVSALYAADGSDVTSPSLMFGAGLETEQLAGSGDPVTMVKWGPGAQSRNAGDVLTADADGGMLWAPPAGGGNGGSSDLSALSCRHYVGDWSGVHLPPGWQLNPTGSNGYMFNSGTVIHHTTYLLPYLLTETATFSKIGFTAFYGTSGTPGIVRLGILAASASSPIGVGQLVVDAGTVPVSGASPSGTVLSVAINVTLQPGLYYLAYNCPNNLTVAYCWPSTAFSTVGQRTDWTHGGFSTAGVSAVPVVVPQSVLTNETWPTASSTDTPAPFPADLLAGLQLGSTVASKYGVTSVGQFLRSSALYNGAVGAARPHIQLFRSE